MGIQLSLISTNLESNKSQKVISLEDYDLLQTIKEEHNDTEEEQDEEDNWAPETDPDDAIIIDDESDFQERKQEDLSGQTTQGNAELDDEDNDDGEEERESDGNSNKPQNSKAIGDWGEFVANRYLVKKYPKISGMIYYLALFNQIIEQ